MVQRESVKIKYILLGIQYVQDVLYIVDDYLSITMKEGNASGLEILIKDKYR